jgi:uncharacterized DUF497 family protein
VPYYFRFFWDGANDEHLAEHGVTPEEFEYVVLATRNADVLQSRTTGRLVAIGETAAGRQIACVYEEIDESSCYPVTAFEV